MNLEHPGYHFDISARFIRVFYASVLGINSLLVLTYLVLRGQPELPWVLHLVRNQLDLTKENVAAVWYAGMLLLMTGMAALLCFKVDASFGAGGRIQTLWRYGWLPIASAFTFFSLDEIGSVHERLEKICPEALFNHAGRETGWVTVLWPLIAVVLGSRPTFGLQRT